MRPGLAHVTRTAGGFEAIFRQSPVATLRVRLDRGIGAVIVDANRAAWDLLGGAGAHLVGQRLDLVLPGMPLDGEPGAGPGAPGAGQPEAGPPGPGPAGTDFVGCDPSVPPRPLRLAHGSGDRWVTASLTALESPAGEQQRHAVVIVQDVTDQHLARERLDRAAREDSLTGVTNRAELLRRLAGLEPAGAGPFVAVVFVDLDGFKRINDTRGHHEGDEVLVAVARRIRAAIRPEDTLARIGGDEFVVLCPRLADPLDARAIADRVRATLDGPVSTTGGSHRLSMSVGIAAARADEAGSADLLRSADLAMYRAKAAGGNQVHHHAASADPAAVDPHGIATALDGGLRAGGRSQLGSAGLSLRWQPVVSVPTGQVSWVAAHVAVDDGAGRLGRSKPVAAGSGAALDAAALVLGTVLRDRASWVGACRDLPVGIDVGGDLLGSPQLVAVVRQLVAAAGRTPAEVLLEVPEPSLRAAGEPAQQVLGELAAAGFAVALTGFGRAGSSLSALCAVRGQRVILDRRLVTGAACGEPDRDFVAATICAAHALGERVVAAGVRTAAQWQALADLGCDEVQGPYVDVVAPLDISPAPCAAARRAGMVPA